MKKIFLTLFLLLLLISVFVLIGRYEPEDTIRTRKADVKISAEALLKDFLQDEAGANENYLNKTLIVSGKVSTFKTDDRGNIAVTLRAGSEPLGVKCKLDHTVDHRRKEFQIGEDVSFKGVCMGFIKNVELVGCVEVE